MGHVKNDLVIQHRALSKYSFKIVILKIKII